MPDISFDLNGTAVIVADDGGSLLEALRGPLGLHSVKDGCSPQGQCGCCTVWVDGAARVACVTPASRVRGRQVTTVEGLAPERAQAWAEALCATGGSQCGFCTPGIIMRLEALSARSDVAPTLEAVHQALLAHLCRCTGWQTITEAVPLAVGELAVPPGRDLDRAAARATLEGRARQRVAPSVALGAGGFVDDQAPPEALVAVRDGHGEWVVGSSLSQARRAVGKVQGRNSTVALRWPIEVPDGRWDLTLQTTWVEPAYLEPDAAWCRPGGVPVVGSGNAGAFGAKADLDALGAHARRLADLHGRPVRVLASREDIVRHGPKRPPLALGLRRDGTGTVVVARTSGIAQAIAAVAPQVEVIERDVAGPPTSARVRAAGWAEVSAALAVLGGVPDVVSPEGARARADIDASGTVHVSVSAGEVLDATVLRAYCIGAAHMALGWVRSEALAVDADGQVQNLTMRSFGVLRAHETPRIEVSIVESDTPAVNGSDAVFAAVAAAAWRVEGGDRWPTGARR